MKITLSVRNDVYTVSPMWFNLTYLVGDEQRLIRLGITRGGRVIKDKGWVEMGNGLVGCNEVDVMLVKHMKRLGRFFHHNDESITWDHTNVVAFRMDLEGDEEEDDTLERIKRGDYRIGAALGTLIFVVVAAVVYSYFLQ